MSVVYLQLFGRLSHFTLCVQVPSVGSFPCGGHVIRFHSHAPGFSFLFSPRCRQFVEMVNGTDSEVCCLTVRSPKSQDSYPGSPLLSPRHGGSNAHLHAGGMFFFLAVPPVSRPAQTTF